MLNKHSINGFNQNERGDTSGFFVCKQQKLTLAQLSKNQTKGLWKESGEPHIETRGENREHHQFWEWGTRDRVGRSGHEAGAAGQSNHFWSSPFSSRVTFHRESKGLLGSVCFICCSPGWEGTIDKTPTKLYPKENWRRLKIFLLYWLCQSLWLCGSQ